MEPLFSSEKLTQLSQPKAEAPTRRASVSDLDHLSVEDLLDLRGQIDRRLPATSLADLNLETELVLQLQQIKHLYAAVSDERDVPANQKAQIANSLTAIISNLSKLQQELYTSERIKAIETALLKALEIMPADAKQRFIDVYERIYLKKA